MVSGKAAVEVEHVGEENFAYKLTREARTLKKHRSQLQEAVNVILKVVSILIVPLGAGLFCHQWFQGATYAGAIVNTVAAVLGMIPEGLVLLISVALAVGVVNLGRRKTLVHELFCIETLARVDVLCLDKTGTLTEGRMAVEDTVLLEEDFPLEEVMGELNAALSDENATALALRERFPAAGKGRVLRTIPFSSERKYSGAVLAGEGTVLTGAWEFLFPEGDPALAARVEEYARQGNRVLTVAWSPEEAPEEGLPKGLRPCALILLSDVIRPDAQKTLEYFRDQDVRLMVISGDNPATVSSIARKVGLPGAEAYIDATVLRTPESIQAAVERYSIFGRVTPEQKKAIVQALKAQGHTVAMTGDGVNDILAMKEADCSVAMAAGSDAAKDCANLVLLDSNFSSMPYIVREGRRVINNIQRSASLFLVKNIFSFLLSIVALALPLAYPFQPLQLSLVTFATIGAPAFFLALEPNHELVHGKFMRNVLRKALPGGLTDFLLVFCAQGFGYAFDIPSDMVGTICTLVILCVGLQILWGVCIPFTPLHWAIWGSMTVAGVGGVFLLARWLPLVRLDLGGTLVLVVLLALSAPTLAGLVFMGERLRGMVNDWKNKKARKHV